MGCCLGCIHWTGDKDNINAGSECIRYPPVPFAALVGREWLTTQVSPVTYAAWSCGEFKAEGDDASAA